MLTPDLYKSGVSRFRRLGVITSSLRFDKLKIVPVLPTFAESGVCYVKQRFYWNMALLKPKK